MAYDGLHPLTIETFMIRFAGALGIRSDNKSQFCSRKDAVMWTVVTSSKMEMKYISTTANFLV
jgi:hypothetical protein